MYNSPNISLSSKNEIQTTVLDNFFPNATTCPLWTSWSPLPVVAEV
jgi:hypothetical protein